MKIALIGTVAQNAMLFRKDMILALKEKNHVIFVFCTDFTKDTKIQIENLGEVILDYILNQFKDIKNIMNIKIRLRLFFKVFTKEFN